MGDESPNMEEILRGSVDVVERDLAEVRSVYPELPHNTGLDPSQRRLPLVVDEDQTLRKNLSGVRPTPVPALWPIYSKCRNSVLD